METTDRKQDCLNELLIAISDIRFWARGGFPYWDGCRHLAIAMWHDLESFDPFSAPGRRTKVISFLRDAFNGIDNELDLRVIGIIEEFLKLEQ
jgi:hypothetical protein